jgi:hypothetical protein
MTSALAAARDPAGSTTGAVPTAVGGAVPRTISPVVATALPMSLMNPLPWIPPFSGEGQEVGFAEWHEHFENAANLAGWDDHWRLVHLTSSLKDTAASFYRSCGSDVRNNYRPLLMALMRRFTPVQLTAVQTQLFHTRLQGDKESVEQFVQDLRKLFNRAYARDGLQAERIGQILLANQFVAGLRPELKRKLIGVDGSLEELVLKARFEEAKGREFAGHQSGSQPSKELPPKNRGTPKRQEVTSAPDARPWTTQKPEAQTAKGTRPIKGTCFNCGLEGNMYRACPYPKKKQQEGEARGRKEGTMSALTTSRRQAQKKIEDLRKQLQEAEALMALDGSSDVLHSMSEAGNRGGGRLRPSPCAKVYVNGVPTKTLIDTGSPATIISLEFVMKIMVGEREEGQSKEQWKINTRKRLAPPDVSLKNYGGDPLNIIAQTPLQLSYGTQTVEATVLIQKGAPNQLLLGTDVLGDLGFVLAAETPGGAVNLLNGAQLQSDQDSAPGEAESRPSGSAGGPTLETHEETTRGSESGSTESKKTVENNSRPAETTAPTPTETTVESNFTPAGATTENGQKRVETAAVNGSTPADTTAKSNTGMTTENAQRPAKTAAVNNSRSAKTTEDGSVTSAEKTAVSNSAPAGTTAEESSTPPETTTVSSSTPLGTTAENSLTRAKVAAEDGPRPAGVTAESSTTSAGTTSNTHNQPRTEEKCQSQCGEPHQGGASAGVVRLFTAIKIPARYRMMARVHWEGDANPSLVMLTPDSMGKKVLLNDGVLEGPCATLIITNKGMEKICLDAGTTLGTVTPIKEEDIVSCGENMVVGEGDGGGKMVRDGYSCTTRVDQRPTQTSPTISDQETVGLARERSSVTEGQGEFPADTRSVVLETEGIAGTPDVAALTVAADGSAEHPKSPGVGLEKETYRGQEEEEVNSQRGTRGQQTKDNPRDRAPEGQGSRRSGDWNLDGLSPRNDREERLLQQLDLELSHLTPLEQTQFKDCLISFADVFALDSTELGTTGVTQHNIETGDHPPVREPPRRVPFALRQTVDELVENMLSQGVIVPSSSP